MTSVQIKNVPPEVHRVLRKRASDERKSLQEYLLGRLVEEASQPTLSELFGHIDKEKAGGRLSLRDAAKIVRAERDAR
jgi:antitoxin FitA